MSKKMFFQVTVRPKIDRQMSACRPSIEETKFSNRKQIIAKRKRKMREKTFFQVTVRAKNVSLQKPYDTVQ